MNEVILNGVSSNTIKGLLIQELPPVSKPLMRANVEEIDGRDGDIITKLGFSAYDKPMIIGLYGDFDIDQVIDFFNSSGQVTFSNEPDKYYNYQILEQIDFQRLIRFRVAEVAFHVQPFKYSTLEDAKTFDFATSSQSVSIRNTGNYYSEPIITVQGTGTINLSLNGIQLFVLDLSDNPKIVLDIAGMNATDGNGNYLNRMVTGNYDNFKLQRGKNTISWTGNVTQISFDLYSRWI